MAPVETGPTQVKALLNLKQYFKFAVLAVDRTAAVFSR
jgi:hypothetical protein